MSNKSRSSLSNPVPQFRWWTIALTAALALLTALFVTVCAQAQTLNYLADLKAGNGEEPYASVVQGTDGNFCGDRQGFCRHFAGNAQQQSAISRNEPVVANGPGRNPSEFRARPLTIFRAASVEHFFN